MEANKSRLVTRCRYAVEHINGLLKQFKALEDTKNRALSHILQDYRITAALINLFYKRLDNDSVEIAKEMLEKVNTPNT